MKPNCTKGRDLITLPALWRSFQKIAPATREIIGLVVLQGVIKLRSVINHLATIAGQRPEGKSSRATAGPRKEQIERQADVKALVEGSFAKFGGGHVGLGCKNPDPHTAIELARNIKRGAAVFGQVLAAAELE